MVISSNDIRFYLSGGTSNQNPIESRGGAISNTEIINDVLQNVFDNVTKVQSDNGLVEYRCIYVKNTGTEQWKNVGVWLEQGTVSSDDSVYFGIGTATISGTEQGPLANETTAPSGNIVFSNNDTENGAFLIGDLAPGAYRSIWLRRTVEQGASTFKRNFFSLRIQPTNPAGSGNTGGGNTGGGGSTGGGGTIPDFSFAAVGDTTCSTTAKSIINKIISRNCDRFLFLGDGSYTTSPNCIFDMFKPLQDAGKIRSFTFGNHDDGEDETDNLRTQYLQHYFLDKPYHSFNYRNVHVLSLYTYATFGYGATSDQYEFAKNDLQTARADATIDWIIVCFHKPIYTQGCSDHSAEAAFRDLYHPLFDQYKVDIMLTGHNHQYQRSLPLKYNGGATPIIASTNTSSYQDLVNPLHFVVGSGGRTLDGFSCTPSYSVKQLSEHGYLYMNWTNNGKKLTIRFYNKDDILKDECTLQKGTISNPPPPPPTGGGGTLGNDQFGIRKIYPTKPNGDEWFFNSANPTGDGRFDWNGASFKKNSDGSYSIVKSNPRLLIFTKGNSAQTNLDDDRRTKSPPMQSFNFNTLANIGYWFQPRDWRDTEFTIYFQQDDITDASNDEFSLVTRSVRHNEQYNKGCGGVSYHCNISYMTGHVRFKKEMYHVDYDNENYTKTNIGGANGRWIGFKGIVYNRSDGKIGLEIWADKDNTNTWVKYHSRTDDNNWGDAMGKCGGSPAGKNITWGSPMSIIKWNVNKMKLKNMSIREIVPPL